MGGAALKGIKVVEFATMISGPYCGKLMADLGADVVKVEPPAGDPARASGPFPDGGPHPERSATFLYNNTSKRGVTLDLDTDEGLQSLKQLLCWADVLVDNHPPAVLEGLGLGWDALHTLNPGLVYTSITPYGRTGPRANVKGGELTLIHAAGLGNLMPIRSPNFDRAPVKMGGSPIAYHGAVAAALATVAAVLGRKKSGSGRLVDVSLHEVMVAMMAPAIAGPRYHKTRWSRVPDRPPAMGRMQTKDGYVVVSAFDDHHFESFRDLIGNPEWCAGDEWKSMAYRANHMMDIGKLIDEWMLQQEKDEIHHRASKKGIAIGPISSAEDVMNNPQYKARGYFVEVDHPEAGKHTYAGWPYRMSASPPRVSRPAPLLGQHNDEVLGALPSAREDASPSPGQAADDLPLKGVRVLEFCWVWAGPYGTMLLANLGAEVIKVEGHKRTDVMRRSVVWPLPEEKPVSVPLNQGISFNAVNMNKKGITLDLSTQEGVGLARKLAAQCDMVVDNMRPGALIKLGLGYEDFKKIRPDIIVASSSGRGHTGPESKYLGYAPIHHAIGGGAYITGYPDDHPSHSTGDVDIMNGTTLAYSLVAALHHRHNTGEGQFIDFSQCEGVTSLLGELFLGYDMTSEIPERMGNAHPVYAPHSLYAAWGVDRWVALEVHDDDEFAALAGVLGQPELAADPRFAGQASRKANEAELDAIIEAWTKERDRDWVVKEFCAAGLAAAPSRNSSDIYADPHLRERGAFVKVDHPEIGELELVGPPWKMDCDKTTASHAPLLGEHNDYVLGELLGLGKAELAELRRKEIIL